MTEQLIDIDINVSRNANPTIWDIENAEKLQFVSFIETKIEEKFSKKLEYYEQLLLSLQEEHTEHITMILENLNYTKSKLDETVQRLDKLENNNSNQLISIPVQNSNITVQNGKCKYLPNYINGFLVYNKFDTAVHSDKIYPQFLNMPNLTELKLTQWCRLDQYDNLKKNKLENIINLEIKWNDNFHLKQDILPDSVFTSGGSYPNGCVNKDTYDIYIKTNNLQMFPNLEYLIINLNYEQSRDGHNNTRIAQNIIEVIEYFPCKIKKITIILEKDSRWLFTGNLEPLRIFCSKNQIEYLTQ